MTDTTPRRRPAATATPVDAVIFDWGGTLSIWAEVEIEDMWRLAADHLAVATGRSADEVLERLVAAEGALWDRCVHDPVGASFRLVDICQAASDDLGVDVAAAVIAEAATHHLDTWTTHVRHDPDAVPTLQALTAAGVRCALLSNTHWPPAFHDHFLERDGLAPYLDVRVYSCEEAHMKPHPAIFATTLARLGCDPARTLMVGDRMHDDVLGAQRAGMRGVWKATDAAVAWDGVDPDVVVRTLPELVDFVQDANGR